MQWISIRHIFSALIYLSLWSICTRCLRKIKSRVKYRVYVIWRLRKRLTFMTLFGVYSIKYMAILGEIHHVRTEIDHSRTARLLILAFGPIS